MFSNDDGRAQDNDLTGFRVDGLVNVAANARAQKSADLETVARVLQIVHVQLVSAEGRSGIAVPHDAMEIEFFFFFFFQILLSVAGPTATGSV